MFKGFYNLTSGMLTQQRNLDVVSNNITNLSTPGYKEEMYTSSTFDEVLYARVGNKDKENITELGQVSYIRATDVIYTNYKQGIVEATGLPLDFAIEGDGFFAIQDEEGNVSYTRMGSFSMDNEGYLCLSDYGRVLDNQGQAIQIYTDKIVGDSAGYLYTEDGRQLLGQVGVYAFEDNALLERNEQGFFNGEGAQANAGATLHWGCTERSNVSMIDQMTEMLSAQRALQSAAQITQMYDNLMNKTVNDIGSLK